MQQAGCGASRRLRIQRRTRRPAMGRNRRALRSASPIAHAPPSLGPVGLRGLTDRSRLRISVSCWREDRERDRFRSLRRVRGRRQERNRGTARMDICRGADAETCGPRMVRRHTGGERAPHSRRHSAEGWTQMAGSLATQNSVWHLRPSTVFGTLQYRAALSWGTLLPLWCLRATVSLARRCPRSDCVMIS
jgi:hypothetical protein